MAERRPESLPEPEPVSEIDPTPILGPNGSIARRLKNYEPRREQLQMSLAVADAIEKGGHLMVEAGTGVGKSFAYLVPAILSAINLGKKVVVSTHTISLQEQLMAKDLPFLRAVMPDEFTSVLVKGRANYISLRRLGGAVAKSAGLFPRVEEHEQLRTIDLWSRQTTDGSRSDLDFTPAGSVWDAVASDHGNCLGKACPQVKDCFYHAARRRVGQANILVVNHALLLSDLAVRAEGGALLPNYDVAIFDEAHTLDDVAAEHLGMKITNNRVEFFLNRLHNPKNEKGMLAGAVHREVIDQVGRTRIAAQTFFESMREHRARGPSNGRLRKPLGTASYLAEEFRKLSTAIDNEAEIFDQPEERIEYDAASNRCIGMAGSLDTWLRQDRPDSVYWIEAETQGRRQVSLNCAPLDVGPTIRRELFDKVPTCILTSATLCVGDPPDFGFMKNRLGLTKAKTIRLGSPFDYETQATLHIPRNLPDPSTNANDFEAAAIRAIPHYLDMTNGRAFVLFTSHRMLETAARVLSPWFAERNIRLLAQTDGLPRSKMVEVFKEDVESVIFGAESFWQGVDVQGEALSNVIIAKLPFSVPDHPLLEARLEEIKKRGGVPFKEYQLPQAIIRLKQGFGRLIRSKSDTGMVVILDPRVLTKPYGALFLDSLPKCPRKIDLLDSGRSGR